MGRYVVVGAGAVGGTIGGKLFEAGLDVTLVARGDHLAALRAHGLQLHDAERSLSLPVPAAGSPSEAGLVAGAVVVLAVKSQDTADALAAVAAAVPPGADLPPIVCAQNGVDNERAALRVAPVVLGMCVMLPATHLEPGHVVMSSTPVPGILDVGPVPAAGSGPAWELAVAVAADLEKAGFSSRPHPAIMRAKHRKLLMNLGNALDAACGRDESVADLADRARAEGEAVLAAAGIDVATAEEDLERRAGLLTLRRVEGRRRGGSSSWQSLARGTGAIEADHLNGEVVLLGRLHGVPTPVNAVLQRVAGAMAAERRPPGTFDPAELRRLVDAATG